MHIPVNVAELVFSHARLQGDSDIECPTSRDSTTNTGHGNDCDIFNLNVGGWLGNENQTLIQEI